MNVKKGVVSYQGNQDIVCLFGVTEDGKQYYFLDSTDAKKFKNGCRVGSTALIEAVDPMVKASHVGLLDEDGKEVIPFVNKAIRPVNDDIILVEVAAPISQSVVEAVSLRSDPLAATRLVSTPAVIKEKLNAKMGSEGRYIFNDQFSEATICDINGNNLVNGEYYSFIGATNDKLYMMKNIADSDIVEYSVFPPEVQSDVTPNSDTQSIDVSEVSVSQDVVENALAKGSSTGEVIQELGSDKVSTDGVADSQEEVSAQPAEVNLPEEQVMESTAGVGADVVIPSVEEDATEVSAEVAVPVVEATEVPTEAIPAVEAAGVPVEAIPAVETAEVPVQAITAAETNEVSVEAAVPVVESAVAEVPSETTSVEEENTSIEDSLVTDNVSDDDLKINFAEDEKFDSYEDEGELGFALATDISEDESSSVDSMVEEVRGDLDTSSLSTEDDDIFASSSFKADSIDTSVEDDFDIDTTVIDEDTSFEQKDSIMVDVAKSMADLINLNKMQKTEIVDYKDRVEKLSASRRTIAEKAKIQEQKIDVLTAKNKKNESDISKLELEIQQLRNKISDQNRVIAEQAKQLSGRDELEKLLQDAKVLLDDSEDTYTYSRVA